MIIDRLGTDFAELGVVAVSAVAIFGAVIVIVRINGLRSFSKMSAFDFAVTVAVGSLVASVAAAQVALAAGATAVAVLLAAQWTVAKLRMSGALGGLVDNTPTVLVANGRFIAEHLRRTRVTELDVRAKLRAANVARMEDVQAVVLETTGDISVLHGSEPLDPDLLRGVAGADLVTGAAD